jgi:hypothetical protein
MQGYVFKPTVKDACAGGKSLALHDVLLPLTLVLSCTSLHVHDDTERTHRITSVTAMGKGSQGSGYIRRRLINCHLPPESATSEVGRTAEGA